MECTVSNDDIVIHVMDQLYESDLFSEDTMTKWEKLQDNDKTWNKCQKFFEGAYIARKRYNDAKGQTPDSISKITETKFQSQDKKEHNKHIQQVTEQNATLLSLVQEQ